MATIPQQHYYDPKTISPTDPEPRHRCHCGFRFDRWEEFTEHIRDVALAAAANAVGVPADRKFTGSSILDAFYNGKRRAVELIMTVR